MKKFLAALACAFCFSPLAVYAGTLPAPVAAALSSVTVSGGAIHQHYSEWTHGLPNAATAPDPLDSESGSLGLFRFSLAHRFQRSGLWAQVRYDFGTGDTTYVGHTQGGTALTASTSNTIHDVRARVGCPVSLSSVLSPQFAAVPFVEGGYYRWSRDVASGTPSAVSETYSNGYVGVGATLYYAPDPTWVTSVTLDGGSTVDAGVTMNAPLSGSGGLGSHAFAGVSLQEAYRLTQRWSILARVSYRYFGYGIGQYPVGGTVNGTPVTTTATEPNSTTEQVRYTFGFAYRF